MARPRLPIDWLVFLIFMGTMCSVLCGGIGLFFHFQNSSLPWSQVPSGCWTGLRIGLSLISLAVAVYFCGLFRIVNIPGGMAASWLPPATPDNEASPIESIENAENSLPPRVALAFYAALLFLFGVLPHSSLMNMPAFTVHHGEDPWTVGDVIMLGGGAMVVLLFIFDGLWRVWRVNSREPGDDT